MTEMDGILKRREKPALLIGNGINMHGGGDTSRWDDLLNTLPHERDRNAAQCKQCGRSSNGCSGIGTDLLRIGTSACNL